MVEGFDGGQLLIGFLMAAVPALIAVARAWGFPSDDRLASWMLAHGVDPGGSGRWLARTHLRRTRWIRTWGFIVGFCVLPQAWLWFTRDAYRLDEWPTFRVGIGCLSAAVVLAELVRPRPSSGPITATVPRVRAAYAPAFTRFDPLAISALFIGLLVWAAASGRLEPRLLGLAVIASLGWLATHALQQWVLSRPQNACTSDELVIDDAIRSTSVINATAFGYGASIMAFGASLMHVHETDPSTPGPVLGFGGLAIVYVGASFAAGLLRYDTKWVVRRPRPTQ